MLKRVYTNIKQAAHWDKVRGQYLSKYITVILVLHLKYEKNIIVPLKALSRWSVPFVCLFVSSLASDDRHQQLELIESKNKKVTSNVQISKTLCHSQFLKIVFKLHNSIRGLWGHEYLSWLSIWPWSSFTVKVDPEETNETVWAVYDIYEERTVQHTSYFFFQYNGLQHHNDSIIGLHHYNVIKTSWNRFSTCSLSDLVEIYTALVNKADYGRKDANVQACCVCMCVIKLSVDCFDVWSLWISIFTADSDAHVRIFTSTALENRKVT